MQASISLQSLTLEKRRQLVKAYDAIATKAFGTLPEAAHDETRIGTDAAISKILGLPDLSALREMLAREPVICATALSLGNAH